MRARAHMGIGGLLYLQGRAEEAYELALVGEREAVEGGDAEAEALAVLYQAYMGVLAVLAGETDGQRRLAGPAPGGGPLEAGQQEAAPVLAFGLGAQRGQFRSQPPLEFPDLLR